VDVNRNFSTEITCYKLTQFMKMDWFVIAVIRLSTSYTEFISSTWWTLTIRRSQMTGMLKLEHSEFHWRTPAMRSKGTCMSRLLSNYQEQQIGNYIDYVFSFDSDTVYFCRNELANGALLQRCGTFLAEQCLKYRVSSFIPSVLLVCIYICWLENILAKVGFTFTYRVTD